MIIQCSPDMSVYHQQELSSCWDGRPFGHNRHVSKSGGCWAPIGGTGELGPHLTQCCLGWGLTPYQVAYWSIQPLGHNRHGPTIGGWLCPLLFMGELGAHLTLWPGSRPISIPIRILIHPTVWPQNTNVTEKTDRTNRQTDNDPIAQGEQFYKRSPKN